MTVARSGATGGARPAEMGGLPGAQVNIMAVACAFAIATLYYNQPLFHLIGVTFGTTDYVASQIIMLGQLGYALGLFLFVPMGDRFEKRKLIVSLIAINTGCLAACAIAPTFTLFAIATLVVGLTTVTPQIIIPTVAGLTPLARRGRTVGVLLSGMSAGLLLGRVLSGAVADAAGWRIVFLLAMAINVFLMVAVWRLLPATKSTTSLSYGRLLLSMGKLFMAQPVLRAACATGFFSFAAFSALWATLAGLLAGPPYYFGASIVGLFGLLGIVSILTAQIIGRINDRLGVQVMIGAGPLIIVMGFLFVSQASYTLWALGAGLLVVDLGYRCVMIANQTRIYSLQADSHSRLNAVFMTSVFLGAAFGSVCGATAARWSWNGLAVAGIGLAVAALLIHVLTSRRQSA